MVCGAVLALVNVLDTVAALAEPARATAAIARAKRFKVILQCCQKSSVRFIRRRSGASGHTQANSMPTLAMKVITFDKQRVG